MEKNLPNLDNKRTTELLQGVFNVLKNDADALRKFTIDCMNINYDFKDRTGIYKILSTEDIEALHNIHLLRLSDKSFDYKFKMILMGLMVIGGIAIAVGNK